jgi:hypothetical protein
VCSIGHDELIAVLLLRQQRGHAMQPAPGLWNGRRLFLKGPRARRQGALVGRPLGTGMVWTVLSVGFDPFQAPTAASWCR